MGSASVQTGRTISITLRNAHARSVPRRSYSFVEIPIQEGGVGFTLGAESKADIMDSLAFSLQHRDVCQDPSFQPDINQQVNHSSLYLKKLKFEDFEIT